MHITHIVAYPPFREGTGTVCYYNAQALRELGCDVAVYAPRLQLSADDEQLSFYHFMPCWLAVGNAFLTPRILTIQQTDLLHLHLHFIFGAELVLLKTLATRVPVVVTYHNDLIGIDAIRRPAFFVYNRLLAPLILRRSKKIILPSLDYAASSIFGGSIFRDRETDVVEIQNGVDTEIFKPGLDSDPIRARHGLHREDVVLLFVASLDRAHVIKGLPLLLETMPLLKSHSTKLLVVGDGDMRPHYAEQARALGIAERVVFAGFRTLRTELPFYYSACDMVVIPSSFESFGVSLAQGMAMGKPVIGCNTPGVRTVVRDGETGFLIEPGDRATLASRIQQLANDPGLRERMGEGGRQRVLQHFTWRQAGERLLSLYETVLDQSG